MGLLWEMCAAVPGFCPCVVSEARVLVFVLQFFVGVLVFSNANVAGRCASGLHLSLFLSMTPSMFYGLFERNFCTLTRVRLRRDLPVTAREIHALFIF